MYQSMMSLVFISIFREDENVVDVHPYENPQVVSKDIIHDTLERSWRVTEAKGHNNAFEGAKLCVQGSFLDIFVMDSNLMEPTDKVYLRNPPVRAHHNPQSRCPRPPQRQQSTADRAPNTPANTLQRRQPSAPQLMDDHGDNRKGTEVQVTHALAQTHLDYTVPTSNILVTYGEARKSTYSLLADTEGTAYTVYTWARYGDLPAPN